MDGSGDPEGEASRPPSRGRLGTPEEAVTGVARDASSLERTPRRIEKPWGYELVWAETDGYVGKLLFVRAGHALSLHFHEEKDETLFLLRGEVVFQVGPGVNAMGRVDLREGASIWIPPGTLHRIEAVEDATFLEASTPELDDLVRLEDRYGRVSGGDGPES